MIAIKRVYEACDKRDGRRILIDRLWPRGLTKEKAQVDLWLKSIAPSTDLRKWFGHDPEKWPEFQKRYAQELGTNKVALDALNKQLAQGQATLVYGAKDELHNDAVVIKSFLEK